jgi:hypothetical protein
MLSSIARIMSLPVALASISDSLKSPLFPYESARRKVPSGRNWGIAKAGMMRQIKRTPIEDESRKRALREE